MQFCSEYPEVAVKSTENSFLHRYRNNLLLYLDGPFIPEISHRLDVLDSILDATGGIR